jgi:hypothetical protein
MFFVTNKDLIKGGLKPSDFFKVDPRIAAASGGKQPALSTGSKLDIALELRKAGDVHTAERVSKGQVPDAELLDRHGALPWLKTGEPADVAEISRRLSPQALAAVGDKPVKQVRAAIDQIADDAAVNAVAGQLKGAGLVDLAPTIGKVRKLNPSSKVELLPDGQIRLDGQITLGPGKLATLGGDTEIKDFLKAVNALKEAGSPEALKLRDPAAAELLEKLGKQRWRFEHHLDKSKSFLTDMGIDKEPLFGKMSDVERERLYDQHVEPVPFVDKSDTETTKKVKQAWSEYAMSRKPKTVEEFVDHFQFARSRYKNAPDELLAQFERQVKALTDAGMNRGPAEKQVRSTMGVGGPGQPKDFKTQVREGLTDPATRAVTEAAENQSIKEATSHTGAGAKIAPGTDDELKVRVAAASGPIPMTDPTTASYHVEKHQVDMPPGWKFDPAAPKPGIASKADAYFKGAAEVIRNPSSVRTVSVAQDGRSKVVSFVLSVQEAGMRKPLKQTVHVLVTPEGNATLLTYVPEKL